MFARWRAAGLILPSLLTLALLPLLIGLGNWQWHRKAWKEDLIAKIDARRTAEPVSYPAALAKYVKDGDVEYLHVRVTGTFDHSHERHLYAPAAETQGWHVYTPLKPEGGLPPVFVNRGWVPDTLKDPSKRPEGQVQGPVAVTGLVRLPEHKGWFTPDNDYGANQWYWRDIDAMRWGAQGPPSPLQFNVENQQAYAPFSIDADATPENPGGWPKGGTTLINLPNSHLQYVVTWYGLAVTLICVFAVFARQRLKALENGPQQS
ncbi:Surfeit locus 1 family protein [Hyphomicrobium denitrificans 1NES1]|uniref:SURF1-like protein n=1 Tax=Hyphomicrobium denitrificans 1NES1 TaxID=670307 RepID=N0BAI6_9HYPH|nr:SURF1 family protein [Hyphomicrobium denitrificans]AGK59282.1 Surfeit locus 1 family protein [Hyphomicrobium denitrificans 1NES1]